MRLLTRSDFDGLACGVLLKHIGVIDDFLFVHPKDLQDGLVEVGENDCLANVPYVKGCGLWFDHHASEFERGAAKDGFVGESRIADSCAHVIYDYYGADKFIGFEEMLIGVDRVDSAKLTEQEILDPPSWILLGFIMDPRTGLGRFRDFRISNLKLMEMMIGWCATKTIQEILEEPDVKERVELYFEQDKLFREMVTSHTRIEGKVMITDLRGVDPIYAGNRFLIYSLYPNVSISAWIVDGRNRQGCSVAVGHSILDRTSKVNVGNLMLKYGGGGHRAVGTCQFSSDNITENLPLLLTDICRINNN